MTTVLRNPVERTRFLKFTTVGVFGAVVDAGILNVLTHVLSFSPVMASSISLGCAIVSNFIWNRYWTYPESRSRSLRNQLGMFALVNLAGFAIRIPMMYFGVPPLQVFFDREVHWAFVSARIAAVNAAWAISVAIAMLWNFFVNRYWTYNDID